MDIDEKIYRNNGFRILGLDITNKNNKIKNRLSKVDAYRNRIDIEDSKPLEGVFDKSNINLLLPVYPSPSYIDFQNAKNRLNDVRVRLIDEIFWLWPKTFDSGLENEVIDYLKNKNYNEAISYWKNQAMFDSLNTTSVHNLAILYHVKALDNYINDECNFEVLNDLKLGLDYWANTLSDSSNFKNFVKQRVNSLNDPRLTEKYVDTIFNELPYDLLNINVIFIKKILNSDNLSYEKINITKKLINIILNSPFNDLIINNISSKILELIDSSIKNHKDSFEDNFKSLSEINLLKNNTQSLLSILKDCFDGNSVSVNIRNSTCIFILNNLADLLNLDNVEHMNIVLDNETKIHQANEIIDMVSQYAVDENIKTFANNISFKIFLNVIQGKGPIIGDPPLDPSVIYLKKFSLIVIGIILLSIAYFIFNLLM